MPKIKTSHDSPLRRIEQAAARAAIRDALARCRTQADAARMLGVSTVTLRAKLGK